MSLDQVIRKTIKSVVFNNNMFDYNTSLHIDSGQHRTVFDFMLNIDFDKKNLRSWFLSFERGDNPSFIKFKNLISGLKETDVLSNKNIDFLKIYLDVFCLFLNMSKPDKEGFSDFSSLYIGSRIKKEFFINVFFDASIFGLGKSTCLSLFDKEELKTFKFEVPLHNKTISTDIKTWFLLYYLSNGIPLSKIKNLFKKTEFIDFDNTDLKNNFVFYKDLLMCYKLKKLPDEVLDLFKSTIIEEELIFSKKVTNVSVFDYSKINDMVLNFGKLLDSDCFVYDLNSKLVDNIEDLVKTYLSDDFLKTCFFDFLNEKIKKIKKPEKKAKINYLLLKYGDYLNTNNSFNERMLPKSKI